ncbi:MAG: hypothetical protein Q9227_005696 [Pyrenula ochraceoflavens]
MEDIPPSYEFATNRDAWEVIAPWISSRDLCAASLVSRKWHSIFAPFLWGDPASHFGEENDEVYVALTRFKRTLRRARLEVRQLTHTLHLPPALSEIYGGPNSTWMRDVLEYLPNLQSLLVSQLPFFDHHSLMSLKRTSSAQLADTSEDLPSTQYGLRLLLAKQELNATSVGLSEALQRFPQLIYLDLSYTRPARDATVLSTIGLLSGLRVLKLRGIGLRDREAEVLANAIGIRVTFLDLRNNVLSDMAVRSLMQACFPASEMDRTNRANGSRNLGDWPIGLPPGPDLLSLDSLRSENLDQTLLKQLTHPLTGRLAIEDIPHRGLTHLYISENRLSVEGLASLLKSTRLHVLDAGSVDTANALEHTRPRSLNSPYEDRVNLPGPEKLVPILEHHAGRNLTHLRINHAIVTKKAHIVDLPSPSALASELPGSGPRFELQGSDSIPMELPATEAVFELSTEPQEPRLELPGDCIHLTLSPPIGEAPGPDRAAPQSTPIRGDGAFAPEPLADGDIGAQNEEIEEEKPVLNASGTGLSSRNKSNRASGSSLNLGSPGELSPLPSPPCSPSATRLADIEKLLRKRTSCSMSVGDQMARLSPAYLHPSAIAHIQTLVLTDVPTQVPKSSPLLPALIAFISACADEAQLSRLQAQTNYSLPPGRSRSSAELSHARTLFALRTIVLEMSAAQKDIGKNVLTSRVSKFSPWVQSPTAYGGGKSSTGDRDSDNLWSAAERDFSFFGEEGEEQEECGIYEHEPDKYFPTSTLNDKIVLGPEDESLPGTPDTQHSKDYPIRSPNFLHSPRNLPLRRRAASNGSLESQDRPNITSNPRSEFPGTIPTQRLPLVGSKVTEEPLLDVVAELSKFRKAKKAEYEEAIFRRRMNGSPSRSRFSLGEVTRAASPSRSIADLPFVEGHWRGDIRVIRNAAPKGRSGVVDIYGNYFEKGYLYP